MVIGLVMNIRQLKNILYREQWCNWIVCGNRHIYPEDIKLSIVLKYESEFNLKEWTIKNPDRHAAIYVAEIQYNAVPIIRDHIVYVYEHKVVVPFPESDSKKIIRSKYNFAKIFDNNNRLDEYIKSSGLFVEKEVYT